MRVIVADDSVLFREGMVRLLVEEGFDVVGQAGDAGALLGLIEAEIPDVAIVDIRMPPTHTDEGLRAAHQIRARHPDVGVLLLSHYVEAGYALQLMDQGAEGLGYLLKDRVSDLGELAEAVRRVGKGGSVVDPEVITRLIERQRIRNPVDDLTERERTVLALMAQGRSIRPSPIAFTSASRRSRPTSGPFSPNSTSSPPPRTTAACWPSSGSCGGDWPRAPAQAATRAPAQRHLS